MNAARVILVVLLVSIAGATEGQVLKQRKPGLWEVQYTAQGAQADAEAARMKERLANMPPEKRAQMEAYMKERGIGVTAGPGGAPMTTIRFCLTPEDIAEESGRGFMKSLKGNGDCTSRVLAQSASEVHIQAHCRAQDNTTTDVDARIFDVSSDHYAVDFKGHGARGEIHMQQKARWLGSDCKGAAF